MVASAQIFQTLLYERETCSAKNETKQCSGETNPFCDAKKGYLYVYTMLFGEFDIEHFDTSLSIIMFVVYTFIVVIVMLNVLIAIVGDSYDKSMFHGTRLFGRARVLFVAELFAFERGLQKGIFSVLICFGDSWGKCFPATMLIGGLAFFIVVIGFGLFYDDVGAILFMVFCGLIIGFSGWWLSNERSCGGRLDLFCPSALRGHTTAKRWCICLTIATLAGLLWFAFEFSQSLYSSLGIYRYRSFAACIGFGFLGFFVSLILMLPWLPLRLNAVNSFLQSILLGFFGLLLGRSASDQFSDSENDRWKNWMGRIHHLTKNVTDTVDGSEDRVKASFHKAVEDSESSVKASVDSLETRLATIETSAKASADSLQASVVALQTSVVALKTSVVALETKVDVTLKKVLLHLKLEKK
jgi:hypothetical protein